MKIKNNCFFKIGIQTNVDPYLSYVLEDDEEIQHLKTVSKFLKFIQNVEDGYYIIYLNPINLSMLTNYDLEEEIKNMVEQTLTNGPSFPIFQEITITNGKLHGKFVINHFSHDRFEVKSVYGDNLKLPDMDSSKTYFLYLTRRGFYYNGVMNGFTRMYDYDDNLIGREHYLNGKALERKFSKE